MSASAAARWPAAPLAAIAEALGYESEAAFSRAFKRSTGIAPAQWRRQAH